MVSIFRDWPGPYFSCIDCFVFVSCLGSCNEDRNVYFCIRLTEGLSGAELVAICRGGAMRAIQEDPENAKVLKLSHLEAAIKAWKPQITPSMLDFYQRFRSSD